MLLASPRTRLRILCAIIAAHLVCHHQLYSDSAQEQTSRSFMYPRPASHSIVPTSFIWQDIVGIQDPDFHGAVRIVPLYQRSRNCEKPARYQLLDCKTNILVAGDNTADVGTRDVRAEYLGLPSNFVGTFSLAPSHQQGGAILSYTHNLSHWVDWSWLNNMWFVCSLPFLAVHQNIHPSQYILSAGTPTVAGAPTDLLQAFNQPSYRYGRMANCSITRGGLSEIDIGIGATWISKRGFLLWYQSTFDIPTFGRTPAQYLWTPTVGINGHVTWSNELAFSLPLQPDECWYRLRFVGNMASHYCFSRSQVRVFDLRHKPWSRYLPLINRRTGDIQPALNVLSRYVEAHPRNFVNVAGGLLFEKDGWYGQAGYVLWVHRTEKMEFLQQGCSSLNGTPAEITQWGIAGAGAGPGNIVTASKSTIYHLAPNDVECCGGGPEFVPLHLTDIDLLSGASHEAFTQALHVEAGYKGCRCYGALGVQIEQAHKNAALNLWVVWGTFGVLF